MLGVEVGVVTGRGFTSSLDVVIVFFSFRSLSWELCLALDASDFEAMVVEEDDEPSEKRMIISTLSVVRAQPPKNVTWADLID